MIEWDEGARDNRDVHEVPEVPEVRARMKNEADVDHLQTNGNKLTRSYKYKMCLSFIKWSSLTKKVIRFQINVEIGIEQGSDIIEMIVHSSNNNNNNNKAETTIKVLNIIYISHYDIIWYYFKLKSSTTVRKETTSLSIRSSLPITIIIPLLRYLKI